MSTALSPGHSSRTLADRLQDILEHSGVADPVVQPLLQRALYGPLRTFLTRPGKGFRGQLVELTYELAGGESPLPDELPLLIECLHAGSLIIDDIQDGSEQRRGAPSLHRQLGVPLALNAGNFLYFVPQYLLTQARLSATVQQRIQARLGQCMLCCHQGQALDLSVRLPQVAPADIPRVAEQVSALKTGALMGFAAALGALAAGAAEATVDRLQRFGEQAGVALQMLDDLSGVLNPKHAARGLEDLQELRVTWAWACLAHELGEGGRQRPLLEDALAVEGESALLGLLDRMRFPLAGHGHERIRGQLDGARMVLAEGGIGGAALRQVEQALAALERRFLEG